MSQSTSSQRSPHSSLGLRLGLSLLCPDRLGLAGAHVGSEVGQGLVRLPAAAYEAPVDLTARGGVVNSEAPMTRQDFRDRATAVATAGGFACLGGGSHGKLDSELRRGGQKTPKNPARARGEIGRHSGLKPCRL